MRDFMTSAQRSRAMARVKNRDNAMELAIRGRLHQRGFRFRKHVADLPGRPDIVFISARLAIFLDGDFWHGYRYPCWSHKLKPFWQSKIESNRKRDIKNFRTLRRAGWQVMRFWGHQILSD